MAEETCAPPVSFCRSSHQPDWCVASGISGLQRFDAAERRALEAVLGPDVCIVAPKAVFGETLGAGGGMGMAAALAWFQGSPPRPIIAGKARTGPPRPPRIALVTSMGFYGNASAVVLRRAQGASS